MKLLAVFLIFFNISQIYALEIGGTILEKGTYYGKKMGLNIGNNNCEVKILEVFEDKGAVIEFEGHIEYLALVEDGSSLKSLNLKASPFNFSRKRSPKIEIFEYTDGPSLRSINKTWDCTMLRKK